MNDLLPNQTFTNVKLVYKNFMGKAGNYNPAGNRNFAMVLSAEQAERMRAKGWSVKLIPFGEEGPTEIMTVHIASAFDHSQISLNGNPFLPGADLSVLDKAENLTGTIVISGYAWAIQDRLTGMDKTGIKNYLVSIDVVN